MDIRLLSFFRVQYQSGAEMDTAETVTFFNDMCCAAPGSLIDKRIKWLETKGDSVHASFTVRDITISAWLYFNDGGELVDFVSDDRFAIDQGRKIRWSTPLKNYREVDGYKLFGDAETIYHLPEKDFCYGTFKVISVAYNCQ